MALAIAKLKNKKQIEQANTTRIVEFVIEKSKKPINIGIILLIENCSNGENNIKIKIKNKKNKNEYSKINKKFLKGFTLQNFQIILPYFYKYKQITEQSSNLLQNTTKKFVSWK